MGNECWVIDLHTCLGTFDELNILGIPTQKDFNVYVTCFIVFPPHPGPLMITFSFKSFFDVSWSPPSDPSEGGVVGYMFSVLGEGCGCMNMSVTGDITCVTCSGWIAAGQTCSFEVRTLSQDCGFISDPIKEQLIMTGKVLSYMHNAV